MNHQTVAIIGSYRKNGIAHQAVKLMLNAINKHGANTEMIDLLERDITFCTNCRTCMQNDPEQSRGKCLINDDMNNILDSIDNADNIILASPINWYSPTAVIKRFMERLSVYVYWPWSVSMPKTRKQGNNKRILILTSSAAPAFIVNLFCSSWRQSLRNTAKFAWKPKITKSVHLGQIISQDQKLNEKQCKKLLNAARILTN